LIFVKNCYESWVCEGWIVAAEERLPLRHDVAPESLKFLSAVPSWRYDGQRWHNVDMKKIMASANELGVGIC
jgi:hypothetical protein